MENNTEQQWLNTPDPQIFVKNAAKYNDLMMMYRCTIREIQTKLEVLNDEFSVEYKRNPISFIKTRIKSPESIYRKLQKNGYELTPENIQDKLNDVAGVRVVCAFIDDIYTVADLLANQDDITVLQVKDYIKNPKPNGYRSYHMIVEIPVFFSKGKTPMRAEVQIRTNGMDFWATLEHQLRYKKGIEEMEGYDKISEELTHSAYQLIEMDNEMQRIKNKIGRFHDISNRYPKTSIILKRRENSSVFVISPLGNRISQDFPEADFLFSCGSLLQQEPQLLLHTAPSEPDP